MVRFNLKDIVKPSIKEIEKYIPRESISTKSNKIKLKNAVMASDAFFPFADSVELAHQQGIHCIIQPGGSKRDDEVIACANKHNIIMLFTGQREFFH